MPFLKTQATYCFTFECLACYSCDRRGVFVTGQTTSTVLEQCPVHHRYLNSNTANSQERKPNAKFPLHIKVLSNFDEAGVEGSVDISDSKLWG